jgi:haloacetate dehalogenase
VRRFAGFTEHFVDIGGGTAFIRRGGHGRPVLLLHGFPQTHVMWHAVAPSLSEHFTVVVADLPGYGASRYLVDHDDVDAFSKRAIAAELVGLMQAEGFEHFSVVGHDRGGRVAYRMALDHPDRVDRLAVLDIVPTSDALERADDRLALAFWPWFLLAQPAPLPERLIVAEPEAIVDHALGEWGSDGGAFPNDVRDLYVQALRDRASVHAICQEYRAAMTIDRADDLEDRRIGRRIDCTTLVLWSEGGSVDTWYAAEGGPLALWQRWSRSVTGRAIQGGHFFPEQNADETVAELLSFLTAM